MCSELRRCIDDITVTFLFSFVAYLPDDGSSALLKACTMKLSFLFSTKDIDLALFCFQLTSIDISFPNAVCIHIGASVPDPFEISSR